jgi:RND family efflux transporter MFP subunit
MTQLNTKNNVFQPSDMQSQPLPRQASKLNKKRLALTLVAFLAIPAAMMLIASPSKPAGSIGKGAATTAVSSPIVSVMTVSPASYQASITAFGEVEATYAVDMAAEISGRITRLGDQFKTGQLIKSGTLLAKINDAQYQQAYLSAQKSLADAQVTLLEEQQTRDQAVNEWNRSGLSGEPSSQLVLNEPQLKAAEIDVAQAKAGLKKAQYDLDNTHITAPFDALVVERRVSPGSYLNVGSEVGTLYSSKDIEIRVLLAENQWALLPGANEFSLGNTVSLTSASNAEQHWQGQVLRMEQHIESDTRQRALILTVDNPLQQGLYPGTFVKADIQGKNTANVLRLPASTLSQQGEIWYVDDQDLLQKFAATPLFDQQDGIIVKAPVGLNTLRIIIRPLESYKPELKVEVKVEVKQEQGA